MRPNLSDSFLSGLATHDAAIAAAPWDAGVLEARARFRASERDATSHIVADCRVALRLRSRAKTPALHELMAVAREMLNRAVRDKTASRRYFAARAVAHFEAALKRTARQTPILESRARAWAYLGELELCRADFESVRALSGTTSRGLEAQTELFAEYFDYRAASAVYRQAIWAGAREGRWKLSAEFCLNRAWSDKARPHHQAAWLDSACEAEPLNFRPFLERAQWEARASNRERALADFDRAIQLALHRPELHEARAQCIANLRAERDLPWYLAASRDYAHALRLRIAAAEFVGSGLEIYRLAVTNKASNRDAAQMTRNHAILSVALEYEPHRASFYARRARALWQLASARHTYAAPNAPKTGDARLSQAAFDDDVRAVQLEPQHKSYRAQIARFFSTPLRNQSAHQQLEGLLAARQKLLSKGLKRSLVDAIVAEIEQDLRAS